MHKHKISRYRIFISHRYIRSDEYQRLVRMLTQEAERDKTWRWQNISVPREEPIMTEEEAGFGDVYARKIGERLEQAHIMLYILRDEWLADDGSIYLELVEGPAALGYRPKLPIISVLPRGANQRSLKNHAPGDIIVKWNSKSIVQAIRRHAIPASYKELRLTATEKTERSIIVRALNTNTGNLAGAAKALGISMSTLRRKRVAYIIR